MGELGVVGTYASRPLSLALVFVASLQFLKWLIPFVFSRFDVGTKRLAQRLKHVELELEVTRLALFRLLNRMAEKYPADPVLSDVAQILRKAWPDPDQDLIDQLDKGSRNAAA